MEALDANPQHGSTSTQMYQPRKLKVPPTRRDARKLFVGGLPSNVTEEEFREFFEQYGAVADSIVMFDRDTHRSRGFGFVTFEDPVRLFPLSTMTCVSLLCVRLLLMMLTNHIPCDVSFTERFAQTVGNGY
jgi:hypothetical protein